MMLTSRKNKVSITYNSAENGKCIVYGDGDTVIVIDKYEISDLIECAKSFEENMRRAGQIRGDF